MLANRPDIVREDYMNELCVLQDDVPPFSDDQVGGWGGGGGDMCLCGGGDMCVGVWRWWWWGAAAQPLGATIVQETTSIVATRNSHFLSQWRKPTP